MDDVQFAVPQYQKWTNICWIQTYTHTELYYKNIDVVKKFVYK